MVMKFRPLNLLGKVRDACDYIQLPRRDKVLLVSKYRLALDDGVASVAGELGINTDCSSQDLFGREYISGMTWDDSIKLNLKLDGCTLGLGNYILFLNLLIMGYMGGSVFDGSGRKIPRSEIGEIYEDVAVARGSKRGEWLDTLFMVDKNRRMVFSHHVLRDDLLGLEALICVRPEAYLQEPGYVDLLSVNSQGLPTREARGDPKNGRSLFYFRPPIAPTASVVTFSAQQDLLTINCARNPSLALEEGIGVRHVKIFQRK